MDGKACRGFVLKTGTAMKHVNDHGKCPNGYALDEHDWVEGTWFCPAWKVVEAFSADGSSSSLAGEMPGIPESFAVLPGNLLFAEPEFVQIAGNAVDDAF